VSLVFDNCSTGTASVTITFSGTPFDSTYTSIYENELIYGAKSVGLQLLSANEQKTLGPNDSYTYVSVIALKGIPLIWRQNVYAEWAHNGGNVAYTVTFNVAYK
jgi:outer membrane usher protein